MSQRHRVIVFVVVLALLALSGVANATVKRHRSATRERFLGENAVVLGSPAASSAWYCPGPIPIRGVGDSGAIAVVNVSAYAATGQLTIALSSAPSQTIGVRVPANSERVVSIPHSTSSGFAAATLLSSSSGVGAAEIIETSSGRSVSPCLSHSTLRVYLAAGDTKPPADVSLSLYDPGATPSVVNVSFLTRAGLTAPPAFQGLPLNPGQLMVLDVGQDLPGQSIASAVVDATGGRVVSGAFETIPLGSTLSHSILAGSLLGKDLYFSSVPSGPNVRQIFSVANPSAQKAEVAIEAHGPQGATTEDLELSPRSVDSIELTADRGASAQRWTEIRSENATAIVASRLVSVTSPIDVVKVRGSAALQPPQVLVRGSGATTGVVSNAKDWLIAGGASTKASSEIVTVANTSAKPAVVSIDEVGTASGAFSLKANLSSLEVGPMATIEVNLGSIYENSNALAFVVHSTTNVVAGAELYARGSSGSFGFTPASAIPVD